MLVLHFLYATCFFTNCPVLGDRQLPLQVFFPMSQMGVRPPARSLLGQCTGALPVADFAVKIIPALAIGAMKRATHYQIYR